MKHYIATVTPRDSYFARFRETFDNRADAVECLRNRMKNTLDDEDWDALDICDLVFTLYEAVEIIPCSCKKPEIHSDLGW